jgi:SAM-dependent methyltransferase
MKEQEYPYMFEEEEHHWWYAGMRAIALSLLPPEDLPKGAHVLDAGCGTGYNVGWLERHYGAVVTGFDFSPHALNFCRMRGAPSLVRADAVSLPFSSDTYDLVICFDVITHLKDERARAAALRELLRILRPGGRLMIRVPAYKFLKGGHDAAVMANHRYGRSELGEAAAAAGFRVLRLTGANTILFPVAVLWRMMKKIGLAPEGSDVRSTTRGNRGFNRALTSILSLEAAILRRCSFPFGLSLFLLAAKPFREGVQSGTP